MPDDGAGIQLTALGATGLVDERQLAQFYTYPDDLRSCWVRGNMIASLDGGATVDGKGLPADIPGCLAGEEQHAGRHIHRPARATEGKLQGERLVGDPGVRSPLCRCDQREHLQAGLG